jgi:SNF2 family DNA or RNA helicase
MPLVARCSAVFDATTRQRGSAYYYGHCVTLTERRQGAVRAAVRGSGAQPYQVRLDWSHADEREVEAYCSCPRYQDGLLCKHIWATMLAVDAQGLANGLRGTARLYVAHEFDAIDDESLEDPAQRASSFAIVDTSPARGPQRLAGRARGGASGVRRGPDWRRQLAAALDQLTETAEDPLEDCTDLSSKRREAWFVLNVGESLKRGKLLVDFHQREQLRSGEFGKLKRLTLRRHDRLSFTDPQDERLLLLLLGNDAQADTTYNSYYYNSYYYNDPAYSRTAISPAMYDSLLPQMCATGRFVWLLDAALPIEEGHPMAWDDGPPWQFGLRLEADEAKQCWRLIGHLQRGAQVTPLTDAVLLLKHGVVLFPDTLARLDAQQDFSWISALRQATTIEVPYRDREELLKRLWTLPNLPQVQLPENLRLEQVRLEPQGKLSIKSPERYSHSTTLYADVSFVYGDEAVSVQDRGTGRLDLEQGRVLLRCPNAERTLLRQLAGEGLRPLQTYSERDEAHLQFPKRRLPELVQKLTEQGWVVESEGRRIRKPGNFNLSVTSNIDWFELAGTFEFEGVTASLPQLLAALRNNEKYVRLGDGSQGMLPEAWLERYGGLAQLGQADGEAVKFAPSQALLLDALLAAQESQDRVQVDCRFEEFRQKLRSFEGIQAQPAPATFTGQLRSYQQDGLGWLDFLRDFRFGGCLADDMGLGKTIQVLALLESRRTRSLPTGQTRAPSLVVVPKSLVFNWIDEAARFTPQLRVLNFTGLGRAQWLAELQQYDLVITTYGTLRRDIVTLRNVRFDYVILDESQAIKNAQSQAAKACRLLNAEHRLAMTGTPIENHLGELWSLFEFLNPGMLGQSSAFQTLTKTGCSEDGQTLPLLAKALRPFLLRRTKQQVLTELPEKTEQTLYCDMEPKQRKLYDSLRDYYRASLSQKVQEVGLQRSKIHVLEALLRLRQAACHPGLIDAKKASEPSAKLELLCEQIEEILAEGHKALIFSQFTSLLAIVRQRFDKLKIRYEYLDGQTRDRKAPVTRFQEDPDCPLFLISLKAGGHGLNLTAADYVFILDPWWNPAVEAQAVDRAHRIGQSRRVFAYRLICKDTVEDKILELQRSKRELADAIVSADNSVIRNLTAEDLQLLLS